MNNSVIVGNGSEKSNKRNGENNGRTGGPGNDRGRGGRSARPLACLIVGANGNAQRNSVEATNGGQLSWYSDPKWWLVGALLFIVWRKK